MSDKRDLPAGPLPALVAEMLRCAATATPLIDRFSAAAMPDSSTRFVYLGGDAERSKTGDLVTTAEFKTVISLTPEVLQEAQEIDRCLADPQDLEDGLVCVAYDSVLASVQRDLIELAEERISEAFGLTGMSKFTDVCGNGLFGGFSSQMPVLGSDRPKTL